MIPIHVIDLKDADSDILEMAYKSFNNLNDIKNELINLKNI